MTASINSKFASLTMTAKAINTACSGLARRMANIDRDVHNVAVAILLQSLPHDMGGHLDGSKALTLVQAMTGGQSPKRVVAWFDAFTNIRVTSAKVDGKVVVSVAMVKPSSKSYRILTEADIDAAIATPFFALNAEADVKATVLDDAALARMLNAIVKRFNPEGEAANTTSVTLTPAGLKMLANVAADAQAQTKRAEALAQAEAARKQAEANRKPARKAA